MLEFFEEDAGSDLANLDPNGEGDLARRYLWSDAVDELLAVEGMKTKGGDFELGKPGENAWPRYSKSTDQ